MKRFGFIFPAVLIRFIFLARTERKYKDARFALRMEKTRRSSKRMKHGAVYLLDVRTHSPRDVHNCMPRPVDVVAQSSQKLADDTAAMEGAETLVLEIDGCVNLRHK